MASGARRVFLQLGPLPRILGRVTAVLLTVTALASVPAAAPAAAAPAAAAPARPAVGTAASAAKSLTAPKPRKPVIRSAVRHDTSPPLRTMRPLRPPAGAGKAAPLPLGNVPHTVTAPGAKAAGSAVKAATADVQRAATVTTGTMPAFGQNFEGADNSNNSIQVLPPDTEGAVGLNDYVQMVNLSFSVYDKQGNLLLGPVADDTVWQGFGGNCDPAVDPPSPTKSGANGGDPVVLYDEQADRWFVSQLAAVSTTGPYSECIAVSQTSDPTGAWFRYEFSFGSTLPDYPKWGVWPDAYYMSDNDFVNGQTFVGATVTALNRAQVLAGQQASMVQFSTGPQFNSLLPSNAEGGAMGFILPAGAPNAYWMSCDPNAGFGLCSGPGLDEWDFHVDWANPANSTFGSSGQPSMTLPVAAFNSDLCNFSRNCIPQPGTSQGLDPISDRLMYQSAYRVLPDGTQVVVLNQTVNVSASGNQAGIRWYELTNTGSGWQVAQQGTYAPDTDNRWMGSANIDANGNIAIGYSVSSASTFPSIRVAGRLAGDPAGQLSQGEETMIAGGGSQTNSHARWGDYSAMQVDPADGCTFWYTQEYLATTSDHGWQTRIGSFKFPSCIVGPHGDIAGTVTDASTGKAMAGAVVSAGSASTTTDSSGHYDLTLAVGTYTETVSAFGYATDTIDGVSVANNSTTTQDAALTPVPSVTVSGTVTDGSGQGWGLHASITVTGKPGGPVWTDPATGTYSLQLPENATYALTVKTDLPGYQAVSDSLTVGAGPVTHNITVPVDLQACIAPGYQYASGLSQNFDDYPGAGGTAPPPGWTIQDNAGDGEVWQFNDPQSNGNLTGGSGFFAVLNSYQFGDGAIQDSSLVTPSFSLSGDTSPVLQFNTDYFGFVDQTGDVDVSTDGGNTWTNIWERTGFVNARGPDKEMVPVPQAAGQPNVKLRFHFTSTLFGNWWEIDNVQIGSLGCAPAPGGLVTGQTTDANTGAGLNGVTVTETSVSPAVSAVSAVTGDPAIGAGFYSLFSPQTGPQQLTGALTASAYQPASGTASVTAGSAVRANLALGAGRLSVSPSSLSSSPVLGTTGTTTMTITNTGTAPASVTLKERSGASQVLTAKGSPLHLVPVGSDDGGGADPGDGRGEAGGDQNTPVTSAGPAASQTWSTIAAYPTPVDDNSADFIAGKEYSVGGVDQTGAVLSSGFAYDPSLNAWAKIANMPVARQKPGVVADFNDKLYVTGGWDTSGTPVAETDVYDPASKTWNALSPNPAPTAAAGVANVSGVLYFVGGCLDGSCDPSSTVETYNVSAGTWAAVAPYPYADAWLSCGGIDGKVYCAGGVNSSTTFSDANVYDPSSNSWSPIASMPLDMWGSAAGAANGLLVVSGGVTNEGFSITNQGFAYDPTTNTWASIPNAQYTVYRAGGSCGFFTIGGSAGFLLQSASEQLTGLTQCGDTGVPWMAESPAAATLQPGQSVQVTVTLSPTTADQVTQPGTYTAQIGFDQDTPYAVSPENLTMTATPPQHWGKIAGTLSGTNCSQVTAPLRGVITANGTLDFSLSTAADGSYEFWAPKGKFTLIAVADPAVWKPSTTDAMIMQGQTTTVNFALVPVTC